jgi:hypothetical protein
MKYILLLCVIFWVNLGFAQNWNDSFVPLPAIYEGAFKVSDDPQLKDLVWHRWTSGNFTVLSLNDQQGEYLAQNANSIKNWILTRWGLPDVPLSAEFRLLCVYDIELMNKLFRLNRSRVEVRKDNGRDIYIGWLLTDGSPEQTLPLPLTQVFLSELDQTYNLGLGFWVKRGFGMLNLSISNIRQEIVILYQHIQAQKKMYSSEIIFNMDKDTYNKLSRENKSLFDRQCMALCLLLRKEFGQEKLHKFMRTRSGDPQQLLQEIYLFKNYEQFDDSFFRYMRDLCVDVVNSKTPDSYLIITPVRRKD